ncbi:Hypothetical protein NTJ_07436 [Nesidiocoris tenuis]|uniref:Uncharacterized protein n=1 Tax=Nesidiocoris tenuis TaxID=355587 RepID=A0ABN7AW02_9HEMI|nr:Hypothetical protein NTJ_07436 [Nesidiocoris tenuis]
MLDEISGALEVMKWQPLGGFTGGFSRGVPPAWPTLKVHPPLPVLISCPGHSALLPLAPTFSSQGSGKECGAAKNRTGPSVRSARRGIPFLCSPSLSFLHM